jgi:hypothetical protein
MLEQVLRVPELRRARPSGIHVSDKDIDRELREAITSRAKIQPQTNRYVEYKKTTLEFLLEHRNWLLKLIRPTGLEWWSARQGVMGRELSV